MAERDLPLSVFHFDCFWMRRVPLVRLRAGTRATFPDPAGHAAPAARARPARSASGSTRTSPSARTLFDEGAATATWCRGPTATVWQWDQWQAGMALVDFTNPDAVAWYQGKLRGAARPWASTASRPTSASASPPTWSGTTAPTRSGCTTTTPTSTTGRSSSCWSRSAGEGEAVLFARSATAGGQQFPVHWGGDCESTFASMAETLRGGLSLAASGFGYWSHDIGGFEGTPDPAVFKRWIAFGLLVALAGCTAAGSYRVPWAVRRARRVDVLRRFTRLKLRAACPTSAAARRGGAPRGRADDAADGAGVPRRPGRGVPGPPVHARAPTCWSRRCSSADGEVDVLPAGRHVDAPADRRAASPGRPG